MTESSPTTRKLILFGVAVAVPLAAVAIYFAVFDRPPPPVQPPAPQAAPGAAAGTDQASLPPIGAQAGGAQASAGSSAPAGHPQVGGSGRSVRVPDEVKGKWQAVRLRVEGKSGGKPPRSSR